MLLKLHGFSGFPIVETLHNRVLLGYISHSELQFAMQQAIELGGTSGATCCYFDQPTYSDRSHSIDMRPWMDQTPFVLSIQANIGMVMDLFQKMVISISQMKT